MQDMWQSQVLFSNNPFCFPMQEEMYSFVTVAEDQATKGKGTTIVQDA